MLADEREQAIGDLVEALVGFHRTLASRAPGWSEAAGGLPRGDVVLLGTLGSRGPMRPGRLAARLGCGPAVVSRRLARVEREELVARRPDPYDGRADLVELTALGRRRLEEARLGLARRLAAGLGHWSPDAVRTAERLVRELAVRLHGLPPPAPPDGPDQQAPAQHRQTPEEHQ